VETLIAPLETFFGIEATPKKSQTESVKQSPPAPTPKKKGIKYEDDDHNEVCEVCDVGGNLLCCDTCTLVFHLECLRPKLSVVPKGKWSCANCIIEVFT